MHKTANVHCCVISAISQRVDYEFYQNMSSLSTISSQCKLFKVQQEDYHYCTPDMSISAQISSAKRWSVNYYIPLYTTIGNLLNVPFGRINQHPTKAGVHCYTLKGIGYETLAAQPPENIVTSVTLNLLLIRIYTIIFTLELMVSSTKLTHQTTKKLFRYFPTKENSVS